MTEVKFHPRYPGMWVFTPSRFYSLGIRGQNLNYAKEQARMKIFENEDLWWYADSVDEEEFWRYEMDAADKDELEHIRWLNAHGRINNKYRGVKQCNANIGEW